MKRLVEWLGRSRLLEGVALIVLMLIALGVWAFVNVADAVHEGESQSLDERVLLAFRDPNDLRDTIGPDWVKSVALDITALGGVTVLVLVTLVVVGFLALEHKRHGVVLVIAATVTGQLMSTALKMGFNRARPSVVPQLDEVVTASFPSGHSLMSAVVYLTLGALVAQFLKQRRARIYVLSCACFVTIAVGLSRVFLGVHYPTDVLAGWTAGFAWALTCWIVARGLQRRGKIEQPGTEPELHHNERASLNPS